MKLSIFHNRKEENCSNFLEIVDFLMDYTKLNPKNMEINYHFGQINKNPISGKFYNKKNIKVKFSNLTLKDILSTNFQSIYFEDIKNIFRSIIISPEKITCFYEGEIDFNKIVNILEKNNDFLCAIESNTSDHADEIIKKHFFGNLISLKPSWKINFSKELKKILPSLDPSKVENIAFEFKETPKSYIIQLFENKDLVTTVDDIHIFWFINFKKTKKSLNFKKQLKYVETLDSLELFKEYKLWHKNYEFGYDYYIKVQKKLYLATWINDKGDVCFKKDSKYLYVFNLDRYDKHEMMLNYEEGIDFLNKNYFDL